MRESSQESVQRDHRWWNASNSLEELSDNLKSLDSDLIALGAALPELDLPRH